MVRHGVAPYLECSSAGDRRFSAFYARVARYDGQSIEQVYQSAKQFAPGTPGTNAAGHLLDWRRAKGLLAINMAHVTSLYRELWEIYIAEHPDLLSVLRAASGLSDRFGQVGHNCQATVLWEIRCRALDQPRS